MALRHRISNAEILEIGAAGHIEDRRNTGVAGVAPIGVPPLGQIKLQCRAIDAVLNTARDDETSIHRRHIESRRRARQGAE